MKIKLLFAIGLSLIFSDGLAFSQIALPFNEDAIVRQFVSNKDNQDLQKAIQFANQGKTDQVLPILKKLAEQDDHSANYLLAKLHLLGLGVEQSEIEAKKWLQSGIAAGGDSSMFALAQLVENDEPQKSLDLYNRAAEQGNALALLRLGSIAESGKLGLRASPKLAFKYYKMSSEAGNIVGDYQMARCYENAVGVSANQIKATRLYRKAAFGGVGSANTNMARRYFEGNGVEKDPVAAVGWLVRGSQAGQSESIVLLGQRYETGDSIGKDLNLAGQLYSRAAKMGDEAGIYHLAMLYKNGIGTTPDPVRAFVLLHNARKLPAAIKAYRDLENSLTPEQIELANKKIAESRTTN